MPVEMLKWQGGDINAIQNQSKNKNLVLTFFTIRHSGFGAWTQRGKMMYVKLKILTYFKGSAFSTFPKEINLKKDFMSFHVKFRYANKPEKVLLKQGLYLFGKLQENENSINFFKKYLIFSLDIILSCTQRVRIFAE